MYKPTVRAQLGRDAIVRQVAGLRQEAFSSAAAAAVKRRLDTSNLAMTSKQPPTGH